MKQFFVYPFLILAIFSCKERTVEGNFNVSGKVKNVPDQKVYLDHVYFSHRAPEIVDSGEIQKGKFRLSAKQEEVGLYRLRMEKNNNVFVFINDSKEIEFNADVNDATLKGYDFKTRSNVLVKKLLYQIESFRKSMIETSENINNIHNNDSLASVEREKLNELNNSFKSYIIRFIDTCSDPVVNMFALGFTRDIDPTELSQTVPNLARRFPENKEVASLVDQYNQMTAMRSQSVPGSNAPGIGSIAPDFTMNDENEKPFSLSSLRGKYVLVDFWASWCRPCRGENPNIVAAYKKYQHKNFTVLGVSLDDDKAAWVHAINHDSLTWKQVSDLKQWRSKAVELYGFDGIPYNVLIDPAGKIIATSLRDEALHHKLAEVLK